MKKRIAYILAVVMVLGLLAGCGGNQKPQNDSTPNSNASQENNDAPANTGTDSAPEQTYTMRIGHILDTESIRHRYLTQFKEIVEEKTNGGIQVEIYPSAQLGSDDELIEQVKNGALEGYSGSSIDTVIPAYNIYSMPFLFANVDEAAAVMNSDWGRNLAKNANENGIEILATGTAGMRVLTNNVRPVHTPEDLKGMKLRTPSWDVTIKTFNDALGVNCTSIAYNETYMALKTNVADGQENPWVYIVNPKFYEVQKYATDLNWNLTLEYFPVNLAWYNTLPAEYQQIIRDAAEETMLLSNQWNKDEEQGYIDLCAEYMEITYLTDEERAMFVDATSSVYDYYMSENLFTQSDMDEIHAIINDFNTAG